MDRKTDALGGALARISDDVSKISDKVANLELMVRIWFQDQKMDNVIKICLAIHCNPMRYKGHACCLHALRTNGMCTYIVSVVKKSFRQTGLPQNIIGWVSG